MSRPLKLQIVEQARALIADESHWCRGELARDVNSMGVCPTSDSAMKRCGLGALIAAAYQLTSDYRGAPCNTSPAPTSWQRHPGACKRHEGSRGRACAVRRSYRSGVSEASARGVLPPARVPDWSQLQQGPIPMARVSAQKAVYNKGSPPLNDHRRTSSVPRPRSERL
jgi:hypothetical protein